MNTNETLETTQTLEVQQPIEQTFTYQPTDEDGLPIGGKQVLKYTDPAQLPYLLAEQNTLLVRKLREQTRKLRLGIADTDQIEEGVQRRSKQLEFKAKTLSPEQRAQLSRDILDEESFDRAITTVFESAIGATADEFRSEFTKLQSDNENLKAIREVEVFQAKNPEYIVCDKNAHALVNWLLRYDLELTAANFQLAFNTLKESDVLITTLTKVDNPKYVPPVTVIETPPVEEVIVLPDGVRTELPAEAIEPVQLDTEHPALQETSTPRTVSRVPLSLNRNTSSGNEAATVESVGSQLVYEFVHPVTRDKKVYVGQQALDAMPSDEYKRRLSVPGFKALADKIEAETLAKRKRG